MHVAGNTPATAPFETARSAVGALRRVTLPGLAGSGLIALVVVGLVWNQQRQAVAEVAADRKSRALDALERAVKSELERLARRAPAVGFLAQGVPPIVGGNAPLASWELVESDSSLEQLVEVRRGVPRLLWTRSVPAVRTARIFYSHDRVQNLLVSDVEFVRDAPDFATQGLLSMRLKGWRRGRDLDLVVSTRSLRAVTAPYTLQEPWSISLLTHEGVLLPLAGPGGSNPGDAVHLDSSTLMFLRNLPLGETPPEGTFEPQRNVTTRRMTAWGRLGWVLVLDAPPTWNPAPPTLRLAGVVVLVILLWGSLAVMLLRRDLRLTRLEHELRHLQELRTKENQLVRAEKLATVGVLVSGLAHEIGTPLGIVAARLELLERRFEPTGEEIGVLRLLRSQIDRVTTLMRQLLDFARSEPGPPVAVDLHGPLGEVRELMEPLARSRGVRLTWEQPVSDFPRVRGEADGIQQILLNLVINALQAVDPNGWVRLSVLPADDIVIVAVEDDGPGIPPARRAAIFDPFFTTKPQGQGSGLGLAVALGLARRMEARIETDDSPDLGGARFRLHLLPWKEAR